MPEMLCRNCHHPNHEGVCGYPIIDEIFSNGLFGIPASNIPLRTDIVDTCTCHRNNEKQREIRR